MAIISSPKKYIIFLLKLKFFETIFFFNKRLFFSREFDGQRKLNNMIFLNINISFASNYNI